MGGGYRSRRHGTTYIYVLCILVLAAFVGVVLLGFGDAFKEDVGPYEGSIGLHKGTLRGGTTLWLRPGPYGLRRAGPSGRRTQPPNVTLRAVESCCGSAFHKSCLLGWREICPGFYKSLC